GGRGREVPACEPTCLLPSLPPPPPRLSGSRGVQPDRRQTSSSVSRLDGYTLRRVMERRDFLRSAAVKYTRRRFLEAAGAVVAAAGTGCSRQPSTANRPAGATGVELSVENAALPDYSHDLERYLVRVVSEARQRRKQAIDAITTPQAIL